jgi:hypothetical protein
LWVSTRMDLKCIFCVNPDKLIAQKTRVKYFIGGILFIDN